jgi:hypothetical protein
MDVPSDEYYVQHQENDVYFFDAFKQPAIYMIKCEDFTSIRKIQDKMTYYKVISLRLSGSFSDIIYCLYKTAKKQSIAKQLKNIKIQLFVDSEDGLLVPFEYIVKKRKKIMKMLGNIQILNDISNCTPLSSSLYFIGDITEEHEKQCRAFLL